MKLVILLQYFGWSLVGLAFGMLIGGAIRQWRLLRKVQSRKPPEEKYDEHGQLRIPRPDPVGNQAFDTWAQFNGLESARRAFGLYEEDEYE
jgi:hypothetical protein